MTHNTYPIGEGSIADEQAKEDGLGGVNQISGSGLRKFKGRRPLHGWAHSTNRLETVL
jgi:hypothetical protein